MGIFLKLDGSEKAFRQDSNFIPPTSNQLLQDINVNEIIAAFETKTTDANNAPVTAFVIVVAVFNKQSNVQYYFNDITVANFLTYLSGLSITTALTQYNGCIAWDFQSMTSFNILLDPNRISNKAYNVGANTTDFYYNYGNTATKIYTFSGNLTSAAVPSTAVIPLPIAASPAATDTAAFTWPDGSSNTYTVPAGPPSQATVHTAIQAFITAHLTANYTYTDVLATNVDTITFSSPVPGLDYVGNTISVAVTGTTFGSSPLSSKFA